MQFLADLTLYPTLGYQMQIGSLPIWVMYFKKSLPQETLLCDN